MYYANNHGDLCYRGQKYGGVEQGFGWTSRDLRSESRVLLHVTPQNNGGESEVGDVRRKSGRKNERGRV